MSLSAKETPSIIALSRQDLPHLANSTIDKASKGGYVILENLEAGITLVSTGSEVSLCLDTARILQEQNIITRVVVSIFSDP